ncbi:hypothetical protein Droror1_Dr00024636, partial [Drosera rotundifolia]
ATLLSTPPLTRTATTSPLFSGKEHAKYGANRNRESAKTEVPHGDGGEGEEGRWRRSGGCGGGEGEGFDGKEEAAEVLGEERQAGRDGGKKGGGHYRGVGVVGRWVYVVEKDVENNVVFVSRNYFSLDKRRRVFRVGSLKWFCDLCPEEISHLQCKVRHGTGFYNCSLTMEPGNDGNEDVAVVHLSEDDQGLATGQFAAFYQGRSCMGSGVILESWDDHGFPICQKALEIARMEDKSKLGKPVKMKIANRPPEM